MNLHYMALNKGKEVAGHSIQVWSKNIRGSGTFKNEGIRWFSGDKPSKGQLSDRAAKEHVKELSEQQKAKKEARALDRDFFISVLGSSATKRDARSYLQRFTPSKDSSATTLPASSRDPAKPSDGCGVNLGGFYNARAVAESPKFVQQPEKQQNKEFGPQLHIALVKIRAPQTLDDEILHGVGRTITQLGRLGLTSVVVVDCDDSTLSASDPGFLRDLATEQAERVVVAIDANGEAGARLVNNVIGISEGANEAGSAVYLKGKAHVTMRKMLMTPLRRGTIPVIPSLGYTDTSQTSIPLSADEVVLALTREFAGFQPAWSPVDDPLDVTERLQALRKEVSLDRLIVLDPLGGIPASDRPSGYHVFLNMEQEFDAARRDLLKHESSKKPEAMHSEENPVSDIGLSNPFSKFVETDFGGETKRETLPSSDDDANASVGKNFHLKNLQIARSVLSMLPPSSSALLTTPDEAANSGKQPETPFQAAGVGTRRQRNPLIHNLLTDKPVFSSSLPIGRLGQTQSSTPKTLPVPTFGSVTPTTFAKHGMSVTLFPDPKVTPWAPPVSGKAQLNLRDSHIDLSRLVHLIEDSFGRKLDVQDYLNRVKGRIAGVIIAGEYEGGALLTWETPPGVVDYGSPESRARMVPYLDKFAVLKKSQGSGGTADVVFKAMVRDCFPDGVCWRSRKTNVVNKWYFERSRGTWKLPDSGWTMFWTTPDLSLDQQKFRDYEGVCRGVVPSWADNKTVLD